MQQKVGWKIKSALKSIRIQAIQDRATIQMRCEPIKGLYKLVCATNNGTLRERTQSMTWIYTAILRANMERWQVQHHWMKNTCHNRGLVITLNTAKIYAISHTRVPAGYAAYSNSELSMTEEGRNPKNIRKA